MREQIFVEIKLNKCIAQNKSFCSVFLCLNHSFIFFPRYVSLQGSPGIFYQYALMHPHNPLPRLPAPKITHAHTLHDTNPTLSGTTQLEKTHLIKTAPPEFSLACFKSKSKKRRGALSKIQCFTPFNRKGAHLK